MTYKKKVSLITTYYLLSIVYKKIKYECLVSYDFKEIYECEPQPESLVELIDFIRDRVMDGDLDD
jgi:hypothetical protein